MAKGFIFDVDGTILDSMEIWMDAAKLYLKDLGIEAEENLGDIMFSLTMAEGAEYIRKTYKVNLSDKEICDGINQKVFGFYKEEAPLNGKSIEILEYAQKNNIPMVVATSTDRPMIEAAFERLNLGKYFKKIRKNIKFRCACIQIKNKSLKKIKKIYFFKYGKPNKENVFTRRKLKSKS